REGAAGSVGGRPRPADGGAGAPLPAVMTLLILITALPGKAERAISPLAVVTPVAPPKQLSAETVPTVNPAAAASPKCINLPAPVVVAAKSPVTWLFDEAPSSVTLSPAWIPRSVAVIAADARFVCVTA